MSVHVHCDRCGATITYPKDVDGPPMPMLHLRVLEPGQGITYQHETIAALLGGVNGHHLCATCCTELATWINPIPKETA